jgi:ABC-type transport system involved in multi-copper enzyme maturation permease subunit
MGEGKRLLLDFSLSFIEITGLIIVVFLASYSIYREIEGKTLYLILSKPIPRGNLIFWKFIGFAWVMGVFIMLQTLLFVMLLTTYGVSLESLFFLSILGLYIKILSILAVILFFASFAGPMVTLFLGLTTYIIGHSGYILLDFAENTKNDFLIWIGKWVLAFFPNMNALNIKTFIYTPIHPTVSEILITFSVSLIYIFILLFLGKLIFEKRSFETL